MNFLKPIFYLTILSFLFLSCAKEEMFDPIDQFETEKPLIKSYANTNYPEMVYSNDETGIWYELLEQGEEDSYEYKTQDVINNYGQTVKAIKMPTITIRYTGKLISNNSVFDSNIDKQEPLVSKLDDLIPAWYFTFIPKSIGSSQFGGLTPNGLQKGSVIRIITPSYYGYGNRNMGTIPPNSPLFFEIEVLDIKDVVQ